MSLIEYSTDEQLSYPLPPRRRTPIGAEPEPDWRDSAACVGVDLNLFFPISTVGAAAQAQVAEAKSVCAECPVQRACLDWALAVGPEFGIFGGRTEVERRLLRQRTNPNALRISVPNPSSGYGLGESSELN